MVTGISTGAIIAPFAFLGKDYDEHIKEFYTRYSTKDIVHKTVLAGVFGGEALADTTPLLHILEHFLDDDAIQEIAAEHRKGRRLYIGTSNLDARRPVIWDIGAIADSGNPAAIKAIPRIILTSAALPGLFPPVLFEVSKDGTRYNELHVDGGIGNQLFLTPTSASLGKAMDQIGFTGGGTIYVIRNAPFLPGWNAVHPSVIAVSEAAIGGLTYNQGDADQYVIYLQSRIDRMPYRVAQISASFNVDSKGAFDINYMQQLFDTGYAMASEGYPWSTEPMRRITKSAVDKPIGQAVMEPDRQER